MRSSSLVSPPQSPRPVNRATITAPLAAIVCTSAIAGLLLILLGRAVRHGATHRFDRITLRTIRLHTAWLPRPAVEIISSLGSGAVIVAIGVAMCVTFALRRRWFDSLFIAGAVGGYLVLGILAKNLVQQQQPVDLLRIPDSQYRFPSGHALGATCLAIALGAFLWRGRRGGGEKILGTLALAGAVLAVGASRLVLNLHYPSDIVGGVLLGLAWMGALLAARQVAGHWWHPSRSAADAEEHAP